MDREARLWKFARLLIANHGKGAFDLVHTRAPTGLDKGDHRISSSWARVADIINRMTKTGNYPPIMRVNQPLDDVLAGETINSMMKADKVGRQELAQVIADAKKKPE
jgi:hypothetical protein